jgi:hypothetical protein
MRCRLSPSTISAPDTLAVLYHRLPFDVLKIDRSFVKNSVPGDAENITRAIVALARTLKKRVIAEVSKRDNRRSTWCSIGCDGLQGFLYARPLERARWLVGSFATRRSGVRMRRPGRAPRPPQALPPLDVPSSKVQSTDIGDVARGVELQCRALPFNMTFAAPDGDLCGCRRCWSRTACPAVA